MLKKIIIHDVKKNKKVLCGHVDLDKKIFYKTVQESKHLYRNADAWGIQANVIDTLKEQHIEKIVVEDIQKKLIYTISLEKFIQRGFAYDFGHGNQIFCARLNFTRNDVVQQQLNLNLK